MMKYGIYSVHDGSKLVKILIGLFIIVSIVYFLFGRKTSHDIKTESHDIKMQSHDASDSHEPHPQNFMEPAIPDDIIEKSKDVHITTGTVTTKDCQVFYREVLPGGVKRETVLLLHGQSFTSQTWVDISTLQLLASMGHRAVAIDIPGYGRSTGSVKDPVSFLTDVLSQLSITSPVVVVSPSMSGRLSLPFLVGSPEKMRGFVAVAPVDSDKFADRYERINVPTALVYGERDKRLGEMSRRQLEMLPRHWQVKIPEAGHAAYMDKPQLWHNILHNFLNSL